VSENGNLLDAESDKKVGSVCVESLKANGYFRNEMSGSKTHSELLNKAKSYFKQTVSWKRIIMGSFITSQLKAKF